MRRNINTNIEINSKNVIVSAIEKIGNSSYVEVYSNFANFSFNDSSFIEKCIREIEIKFGTKIEKVSVVIAQSKSSEAELTYTKKMKKLLLGEVALSDIDSLKDWIEEDFNSTSKIVTLIQPFKYYIYDSIENKKPQKYKNAPIGIKGEILEISALVTTINRTTIYNYIHDILSRINIQISQILLNSQAEMFCSLSDIAQEEGGILLRVGENRTTLSIVKNYATVKSINISSFGMSEIYKVIAEKYNISYNASKTNVIVYGSFEKNCFEKVIPIQNKNFGENDNTLTNTEINKMLVEFIEYIIKKSQKEISEFIKSNNSIPLVLTGEITKIRGYEQFVKEKMEISFVSKYTPMTYAETNSHTLRALGVSKFFDKCNEVHQLDMNLTIDTNPDSMKVLWNSIDNQKNKKFSLLKKWLSKIGEKYGYQ